MQSLFQALDDYSIDNRGDVGSWVREAAMHGLERCTYALCKRDAIAPRKETCVEQVPDDMTISDSSFPLFDSKLATSLVGGIAKQAVEKIDKIREIAIKTLQRTLYNQKPFVPFIPYRELLEDIIPNDTNLKWAVPAVSYPRFVQLLHLSCYSKFVLSGLVVSVGGLQESLRKVSVTALMEYIEVSEAVTDGTRNSRDYMLSTDLLWILQQYKKCDRVIIPTLKTIEILLSRKVFLNMEDHTWDFGAGIMSSLAVELKGSRDFTKLCTGISVLGYIASLMEPISSRALSQLLSFLGHRYPKIRKAAADQVYLVLLQNVNLVAEDRMEQALEVLSESCWEGDLEEAKHRRAQLYELAGLETNDAIVDRESTKNIAKVSQTDENVSYSSLVDFSGF